MCVGSEVMEAVITWTCGHTDSFGFECPGKIASWEHRKKMERYWKGGS
jgi:hypothetical protein